MNSSVNTQREIIWQFFHPARKSKNIWLPLYWVGYSGILIANLVSIELFGHFFIAGAIACRGSIGRMFTKSWPLLGGLPAERLSFLSKTLLDTLRLVLVDPQHGLQNKFHWNYSFAAPNSISKHLLHTSAAQSAKCSFPQQQGTKEVSWSQSMTPISTNHGVCLELGKVQQWPSSFVKYTWWCVSSL